MKYLFGLALAFVVGACSSSGEPPLVAQDPLSNDVRPSWVVSYTEIQPDPTELDAPEITHTDVASLLAAAEGAPGPVTFYDNAWLLIAHGYSNDLTQVFPAPDVILEFSYPFSGLGGLWAFDGCQLVEGEFTLEGEALTSSTQFVGVEGCFDEQFDDQVASIYEERSEFFLSTLTGLNQYQLANDLLVLTSAEARVLVLQWMRN